MTKFRVKPKETVIVDAWEWDESKITFSETGLKEVLSNGSDDTPDLMFNLCARRGDHEVIMRVEKGEFIVKYGDGSFQVMSRGGFDAIFEPLNAMEVK
jgi:hypothetical protein